MKNVCLEEFDCISFDIFDTLIKRSVAKPSDLFSLMDVAFSGKFGTRSFSEIRRAAERRAIEKKGKPVTINEIYEELRIASDISAEDAADLMQQEIAWELECCAPNPKCVEMLEDCIASGKKVVLISDMYLPSEVLGKMLEKCGINGYSKIYVSCECGVSKASGELFRYVLSDLGISASRMCHVGDNFKSDILRAMLCGIKTCHIKNDQDKLCELGKAVKEDSRLAYRTILAATRNSSAGLDKIEKLGCDTLGPILLGFTLWLERQLDKENIKDVFFMSRDGYVMKKAFDSVNVSDVKSHYLYCSRRSYTVPMLWLHSDFESIFKYITIPKRVSLGRFLIYIGLASQEYENRAKEYGLELDRTYENNSFFDDEKVRSFYASIEGEVAENSRKEYDALLSYIKQTGMHGKIAVVDIGRHGTMQNALQQLIETAKLDIEVVGYYVGVSSIAPLISSGKIRAYGYLHHLSENDNLEKEIAKFVPIFESVFLAQHGSVEYFKFTDDGIAVPHLYPYEYDSEEGKLTDEKGIITNFQKGALAFVEKNGAFFRPFGSLLSPEAVAYDMIKMGTDPSLYQAKLWGDFRVFDMVVMMIARPGKFIDAIKKPRGFKKRFMLSVWKIGFMRRVLKLPLPYNAMYCYMQKAFLKQKTK